MPKSGVRIITKNIFINVRIIGLEKIKKNSANRNLKIKSTCTGKTKIELEILEA